MFIKLQCSNATEASSAKLTNLLAQWIALNCQPISVDEDEGLELLLQVATGDLSYKLLPRGTIVRRVNEQHAAEKASKEENLAGVTCVALNGDHWSSVNNENYLGVIVHLIDAGNFTRSP